MVDIQYCKNDIKELRTFLVHDIVLQEAILNLICYMLSDPSSDLDHSSYARNERELRPRSRLSQQNNIPGHGVDGKGKKHRSRHSSSTRLGKNHNYEEANRHLTNWIRSQDARKHTRDASSPLASNAEDAETVVMIVKEEFKRLGFL